MPVDRTTFNNRCLACKAATYQCGPCQKADDLRFKVAKEAFKASKGRPAAGGGGSDAALSKSYLDNVSPSTLLPLPPVQPLPHLQRVHKFRNAQTTPRPVNVCHRQPQVLADPTRLFGSNVE